MGRFKSQTDPLCTPQVKPDIMTVMQSDVRQVVAGPDGERYEVVGIAKDWSLGTGSILLDAGAFIWAVVRRARGNEWVVSVRRAGSQSDPITIRAVKTREDAVSCVAEMAETIKSGHYAPPAE